jgi:hypothetical protein
MTKSSGICQSVPFGGCGRQRLVVPPAITERRASAVNGSVHPCVQIGAGASNGG